MASQTVQKLVNAGVDSKVIVKVKQGQAAKRRY